jgi:SAM-dependent methyltransferase
LTDLEAYAKRYAAQYSERSFETLLIAIRRRHVLHWLARYGARRVLEVGCGLEPLFSHHTDFDTWRIVEPIAEFAGRARELAVGDDRIEVWEGYVEEQTDVLADESLDFVIVSGLLHEVRDPLRLLEAVRSLCGDTTIVHVNVPNMLSFHRLLALEMGLIADVYETSKMDRAFGHLGRFDHERFINLLAEASFRVAESGTYFVKPFTHDQMDAILRTGAFPPSLTDGLDRMTKYMPDHGCELYANARRA